MGADRRAQLLDAAERVLSEKGLAGATVGDITAAAGVAKGTFYLYFQTKDDVVAGLQQRLWEGLVAATLDAVRRLDSDDDWWGVVDEFLATMIDYDLAHRDWHRLVAQGWSAPYGADMDERERSLIAVIADAIRHGIAEGHCHASDPDLAATLLYRACQGTGHQLCRSPDPVDRDRVVAATQELVRKALAP